MVETRFTTTLSGRETGPTGIVVPPACVAALGAGKKPGVQVRVNGHAYPSTVAVMGGQSMIPFAAEHRKATGLKAGDPIDVTLTLETAPRTVDVPDDLAAALQAANLRAAFDASAPSKRKEWVRQVVEAKAADTRVLRVHKVVEGLRAK
jgi:Bacteriocin-protection, YdeI or OmpD-Associated/Domain of unknown function (DUF1905)